MRKGSYYGLIMVLLFVVALITSGCGGSNRKDNEPTEYVKVVYDGTTYMFTSGWVSDDGTPCGRIEDGWLRIFGSDSPTEDDSLEPSNNGCNIQIVDTGTGTHEGGDNDVYVKLDGKPFLVTDPAVTLQKYEIVGGEIIGEFNGMIETKSITGSFKVKRSEDSTRR